jgi:Domain of unknown function (DUF4442)
VGGTTIEEQGTMNVIETPFIKKVGIEKTNDGKLVLAFKKDVQNHLQTICAGAQYTLAETSSADFLQNLFPELIGKVIPIIRDSQIKFKQPAIKKIFASSSVSDESRLKFSDQFSKKGRALISVDVKIIDIDGVVTCLGTFTWFIQNIVA